MMKIADHKKLIFNYDKIEQLDRCLKQLIKKDNRLQSIWNESRNYSNETLNRSDNCDSKLVIVEDDGSDDNVGLKRSHCMAEEEDAQLLLWKPCVEPIGKNWIVTTQTNCNDEDKTPIKHWPDPKYWKRDERPEDSALLLVNQVQWKKDIIWDGQEIQYSVFKSLEQNSLIALQAPDDNLVGNAWENDIIWDPDSFVYSPKIDFFQFDSTAPDFVPKVPKLCEESSKKKSAELATNNPNINANGNNNNNNIPKNVINPYILKRAFFKTKPTETISIIKNESEEKPERAYLVKEPYNISNDKNYNGKRQKYVLLNKMFLLKQKPQPRTVVIETQSIPMELHSSIKGKKIDPGSIKCSACGKLGHRKNNQKCPAFLARKSP